MLFCLMTMNAMSSFIGFILTFVGFFSIASKDSTLFCQNTLLNTWQHMSILWMTSYVLIIWFSPVFFCLLNKSINTFVFKKKKNIHIFSKKLEKKKQDTKKNSNYIVGLGNILITFVLIAYYVFKLKKLPKTWQHLTNTEANTFHTYTHNDSNVLPKQVRFNL